MSRKKDREMAFTQIFESCFHDNSPISFDENGDVDSVYVNKIYNRAVDHKAEIDELLTQVLSDFALDRVFKVDYAILLMGVYEMLYTDTPARVVVNECVDICKKFSTDKSYSFVNGVFAKIIKLKNLE